MTPSSLRTPDAFDGSRSSIWRRRSLNAFDTFDPASSPPRDIARTGASSMRLLTADAARMSASPIVRMLSAFWANSGERESSVAMFAAKSFTISLSPGTAAWSSGTIASAAEGATASTGAGGVSVSSEPGGSSFASASGPFTGG